jgi:hypothetical protein
MRNWRAMVWSFLAFAACMGGAVELQDQIIYRFYNRYEPYRDWLYVPSQGYLRAVSIGYDQFFADFLWLRMIQTFAAGYTRPEIADQMHSYFEGITNLSPQFIEVYSFGLMAMGEDGHREDMAKEVVYKSFYQVPGNWKIPSEGAAFFGLPELKDPIVAKTALRLALFSPDHPDYLNSWLGYFDAAEGRYRAALEQYLNDFCQACIQGDAKIIDIRRHSIEHTMDVWYKQEVLKRGEAWERREKRLPTLAELNATGAFRGVEVPDWKQVDAFLDQVAGAGKLQPISPQEAHDLASRFVRSWDVLPEPSFASVEPNLPNYCLVPLSKQDENLDMVPQAAKIAQRLENGKPKPTLRVFSKLDLLRQYQQTADGWPGIAQYYASLHKGKKPQAPGDTVDFFKNFKDPFGGEFVIDPKDDRMTITSVPDIHSIALPSRP